LSISQVFQEGVFLLYVGEIAAPDLIAIGKDTLILSQEKLKKANYHILLLAFLSLNYRKIEVIRNI
jgi:hypothetical protein